MLQAKAKNIKKEKEKKKKLLSPLSAHIPQTTRTPVPLPHPPRLHQLPAKKNRFIYAICFKHTKAYLTYASTKQT
jgi:hypothetical protein